MSAGRGLLADAWRRLASQPRRRRRAGACSARCVVASLVGPALAVQHRPGRLDARALASPPSLGERTGSAPTARPRPVRRASAAGASRCWSGWSPRGEPGDRRGLGRDGGLRGGRVDDFMMRFVDVLYALPYIFLVILLMVFFSRSLFMLFVALGAVQWLTMARIVRGQVLSLQAARPSSRPRVALGRPRAHHLPAHRAQHARPGDRLRHAHRAAGDPARERSCRSSASACRSRPTSLGHAGRRGRRRNGDRAVALLVSRGWCSR